MGDIFVVDTNVLLVANKAHADVSPECVIACVEHLERIMKSGVIAVDDAWQILGEYKNKTSPNQPKNAGDMFLKWVLQNRANPNRCHLVAITQTGLDGFDEFPVDTALSNFDRADRKFVAVAATHPERPPILQAADSKWLEWQSALAEHDIKVIFLCPGDVRAFQRTRLGNV